MVLIIITAILIADQFSKFIVTRLLEPNQSIQVIKGLFYISLVHNRGAAFGILKDRLPVLILVALFTVFLILRSFGKENKTGGLYNLSLSLILAGAIGNLVDRIIRGYVIDFIDFRVWPVFNIADSAITIGACILGWQLIRSPGHQVTRSPGQKH